MYAETKVNYAGAANAVGAPPQVTMPLLQAADDMERAIGEAMSMAEMLAERLTPILSPKSPQPANPNGEKLATARAPFVETVNRQRTRVQAISNQLSDLLGRLEV